jgi:hypothetical protein
VLVLLLVLELENSRYLTVTLIERSGAGRFGPCFDAGSQQIEHEHDDEHKHDSLTSESGLNTNRLGEATLQFESKSIGVSESYESLPGTKVCGHN